MVDIKGKGILYEYDDEPIKLTDHDISQNINEFKLSLIGKILNPKKQSVEKFLQKMPVQWGMEERITANDLGNGKFLLNFTTEDDLNSVLRQGPFHFNFCMFVLVRWEPIVHDDYLWLIPFWTRFIGVPLHIWTKNNLKEIGSWLGHVHQDTIELIEGRMLLNIDSRRPLKFARKAESPEGDEVTTEIKNIVLPFIAKASLRGYRYKSTGHNSSCKEGASDYCYAFASDGCFPVSQGFSLYQFEA
ncbi:uncharacterized protein LOC125583117 [Brassica napus]|uniref:uncharacterized protein LOC125583117 n=1 Tax=Brassica napus TaxID=3708 RepID=UPI0020793DD5|nr:uncharacterized protein LOC125583117 [Brassica napus]